MPTYYSYQYTRNPGESMEGKQGDKAASLLVSLRSTSAGTFVSASKDGALSLQPHCKVDEIFAVVPCGPGNASRAFRTAHGTFLSAWDKDHPTPFRLQPHCREWEHFSYEAPGSADDRRKGAVCIRTHHGTFIGVSDLGLQQQADTQHAFDILVSPHASHAAAAAANKMSEADATEAITSAMTKAEMIEHIGLVKAAVEAGLFDDPPTAMPAVVEAARGKKAVPGLWDRDVALAFGSLLKLMREPPPPAAEDADGGGGGGEEVVVNWEDLYRDVGSNKGSPEDYYKGRDGIHFAHPAGFGIIPGASRKDPGNWKLEGTNGPAIWAIWGEDGDTELTFDRPASRVSFDVRNREKIKDMVVKTYLGGSPLSHLKRELTGDGNAVNTFELEGPLDRIVIQFPKPFGLDNIRFQLSAA